MIRKTKKINPVRTTKKRITVKFRTKDGEIVSFRAVKTSNKKRKKT